MSNSFITNKEKFLSDIIKGILPKTDAVDILVVYKLYDLTYDEVLVIDSDTLITRDEYEKGVVV